MAKGFKDDDGKFHPTDDRNRSPIKSKDAIGSKLLLKPDFVPSKKYSKFQQERIKQIKEEFGRLVEAENVIINPRDFTRATDNDPNWVPDHGFDSVRHLKDRMEKQQPIDKPFLIIDPQPRFDGIVGKKPVVVEHEGRHRNYVARKLGIQKIPVDVYCKCHGILGCNECKDIDADFVKNAKPQWDRQRDREIVEQRFRYWMDQWEQSDKQKVNMEKIFT